MINNRQNGRRRGRGGGQGSPRPNGSNGGQDRGNRIDNRARGNAAQLLEKYKALARDAQMQGDRVNTEYYLQFADHYFRVLSESRSRFEEQQPRPRREDYAAHTDDEYGDEGDRIEQEEQRGQPPEQSPVAARENRAARHFDEAPRAGDDRGGRMPAREAEVAQAAEPDTEAGRGELPAAAEAKPSRRRGRPPRQPAAEQLEIDRLPPSLSVQAAAGEEEADADEKPRPRTRTRRPRGEAASA